MPQRLSYSTPKARKEHKCMSCYTIIRVGEVYSNESYVYDKRVYTWKMCADCLLIINDVYSWWADSDWGVGSEEFLEWAIENHELPEAAAYLERVGYEYPED
jgi:hypothetical protein